VLTTNTELAARDLALKYKQLWTVEAIFRTMKSQLNTRPIYHRCDDTIRGHVFCSFLALVLRKALEDRLAAAGHSFEWQRLIGDLEALQDVEIEHQSSRFVLRTQARGT
jgi:transposase